MDGEREKEVRRGTSRASSQKVCCYVNQSAGSGSGGCNQVVGKEVLRTTLWWLWYSSVRIPLVCLVGRLLDRQCMHVVLFLFLFLFLSECRQRPPLLSIPRAKETGTRIYSYRDPIISIYILG